MLEKLLTNKTRLVQFALVAAFILPLLAHMYLGQFSRLLADDYCFGSIARSLGWWDAQVHWFNNWQGTYSSTAVQSAFALLGVAFLRFLPAILILTWLLGMIWAVYQFARLIHLDHPIFTGFFGGSLITYAVVDGAPNVFQAIYWTSGSVTYVTPMVMLAWYAGFVFFTIRRTPPGKIPALTMLVSIIVTFAAGGFSPIYVALQGSIFGLAMLACWFFATSQAKRTVLPLLAAGLIGSVLALVLMLSAPGNAIRQSRFPPPPDIPMLIFINLYVTGAFAATTLIIFSTVPTITALVFSGFWANKFQSLPPKILAYLKKRSKRLLAITLGLAILLLLILFLPSSYSVSDLPPARALIIPEFVLVIATLSWGVIMGIGLQRPRPNQATELTVSRTLAAVLLILVILGPLRSTWNTLSLVGDFSTFASEWDQRDQAIREAAANQKDALTVPAFTVDLADYVNVKTAGEQAHNDVNRCIEDYYELGALFVEKSSG